MYLYVKIATKRLERKLLEFWLKKSDAIGATDIHLNQ